MLERAERVREQRVPDEWGQASDRPGEPPPLDDVIAGAGRLAELVRDGRVRRIAVSVGDLRWEVEGSPPATAGAPDRVAAAREDGPEDGTEDGPADGTATGYQVRAPLVGVCYLAPAPGAPPFVEVGQSVRAGQQLAIVEAMKLMNEVVTDVAGVVREIHCADAEVVEFGAPMFTIEPE